MASVAIGKRAQDPFGGGVPLALLTIAFTLFGFFPSFFANPLALVQLIARHSGTMKVRPDQKIVVTRDWPTPDDRLAGAKAVLTQLAKLAQAA